MSEFHGNNGIKIIDDNLINKFNITSLFGKKTLEGIQEKIAKATGLAFVTVDFKGEPITEMTSFTKFCLERRNRMDTACHCKASDAFGGIQAAVTQKNCVYLCPCGLLEIAIPIIVRGHYLGAFIGGQVRCIDTPKDISRLENLITDSNDYKKENYMKELFDDIPIYKYEKFVSVAELISLIINQMGEKGAYEIIKNDTLKKELEEINNDNKKLKLENDLKNIEISNLKAKVNPYSLLNILNSISSLAIIEDSPRTNDMIILFAEYLKQNFSSEKSCKSLNEEFDRINTYLKMQKIKYGELLNYTIDISEIISIQKVPCDIIIPFVENAIFYGITTNTIDWKIEIDAHYEKDDVVISIRDNGLGLTDKEISKKFKIFKDNYEGYSIKVGIRNAREKLIMLFGKEYDVLIENIHEKGTTSIIRYPRNFDERNV
ncbi:sensor histidine kinase [Clostridium sardiniense]|uniref:sensor histidine kinase n=1 Tax=Clostridium sardiniense TaxID=29369 RepID=UPI003D32B02F